MKITSNGKLFPLQVQVGLADVKKHAEEEQILISHVVIVDFVDEYRKQNNLIPVLNASGTAVFT